MTTILTYIGGAVVGFAAVTLVGYALLWALRGLRALGGWFTEEPGEFWMPESRARRANAAAILTARRVGGIRLPFSCVLVWRSNVRWHPDQASGTVDEALRRVLKERGEEHQ